MKQIFVRGISRSGGTLMVTILDAHPEVAMSYELYPNLLSSSNDNEDQAPRLLSDLQVVKKSLFRTAKSEYALIKDDKFRTFAARVGRAGVNLQTLLQLVKKHIADGKTLSSFSDRMHFIESIAKTKMKRQSKQHWGTKITSDFKDIKEVFPDAYILFMLRDGRDIAASRKNVGNFNQSIEEIASSWSSQIKKFQQWVDENKGQSYIIRYERLISEPKVEIQRILEFLGLLWNESVMSYYDQDLTIYKSPAGHLSANQIRKPIFSTSVQRYKNDLTSEEVASFEAIAGDTLESLGYSVGAKVQAEV